MLWTNLRSDEFPAAVEKCNGVCVIPVGCVEAHGIHLPLGCDTIKGQEFALRASEKEHVCVFPGMWFGEKSGVSTKRFAEFTKHKIYTPFGWMGDYPDSYSADMHYGLNERIARAIGEKTVENTCKAFKFIREEKTSVEFHKEWLAKQK